MAAPAAQQTPPQTPFRFERPVQTGGAGPRRLPIDVTLLAGGESLQGRRGAGTGLTDLRLFDPAGQEVQYLLVSNPPEQPVWRSAQTLADRAGRDAHAEDERLRSRSRSGDHDRSLPHRRDLAAVSQARAAGRQRRSRAGGRCSSRKARSSICRTSGLVQTELAFTPGPYRYIRVTWDDTRSGQVPRPPFSSAREVRNVMAAAAADDAAGVRAATERAGSQPVPRASAGGAAADRRPRRGHGRHARPARGDGVRSPL